MKVNLKSLPDSSGVYQFLNDSKEIIYIGKAKNLKKRVSTYFHKNHERAITSHLSKKIASVKFIVTKNEKEALILENTLIKQHQPFYNINLKDNKTYPYLWLTTHEKYPRLLKIRNKINKGIFFGPYTNVRMADIYLEILHSIFPIKKCSRLKFPKNFKPCFYFHLGKCLDYCLDAVSGEETKKMIAEIKNILRDEKKKKVLQVLQQKMKFASEQLDFEKALLLKKKIEILSEVETSQQVEFQNEMNFDVWHYHLEEDVFIIVLLEFRGGKLIEKKSFDFKNPFGFSSAVSLEENFSEESSKEFSQESQQKYQEEYIYQWIKNQLSSFIINFYKMIFEYLNHVLIPQILTANGEEENIRQVVEESFYRQYQKKRAIVFRSAQRGKNHTLLNLAKSNAVMDFRQLQKDFSKKNQMKYIREFLNLSFTPKTIESFDIANTGDAAIMAGMVHFDNGEMVKKNYRLFNIRSTEYQNDFLAMEEAIYRRYKRLKMSGKDLPDIILIDGGKGQLSSAAKSLQRIGIGVNGIRNHLKTKKNSTCLIAIAKREEEIYRVGEEKPLQISLENHGLKFLIAVRNETHRFVNKSHIRQRDKKVFH